MLVCQFLSMCQQMNRHKLRECGRMERIIVRKFTVTKIHQLRVVKGQKDNLKVRVSSYLMKSLRHGLWAPKAAGTIRSIAHLVIKFPAVTTSWEYRQENFWTHCSVPLQILDNYAGMATWYISDGAP